MAFSINSFHGDRFQISFSNLPGITNVSDLEQWSRFARAVTFPDQNLNEMYSDIEGFRIRHYEAPKANVDLSQIQISFVLNEDMSNYLYLFDHMQKIKYGNVTLSENEMFRKYTVKRINIEFLDNEKRRIAVIGFTEAFLLSLSSFPLEFGSSEEIIYTTNWSYEELKYEKFSVV